MEILPDPLVPLPADTPPDSPSPTGRGWAVSIRAAVRSLGHLSFLILSGVSGTQSQEWGRAGLCSHWPCLSVSAPCSPTIRRVLELGVLGSLSVVSLFISQFKKSLC